jgi:hypothetical protein
VGLSEDAVLVAWTDEPSRAYLGSGCGGTP